MNLTEIQAAARQAESAKNWSQAASLWETAYQQQQDFPTNQALVAALRADEKYTAAYHYAVEFETDYLKTDDRAQLYVTLLIAAQQFISARIVTIARVTSPAWQTAMLAKLKAAEARAEQDQAKTLTTTMRQFYHLSDLPLVAQAERIQTAQRLTYDKYLTAAKFLLIDPFLHPLSRVEVLDSLRLLGVTTTVQFRWLDGQEQSLTPAELTPVGQDAISQATLAALAQAVGQQDVSLYTALAATLKLQLMYLYPYPNRWITDASRWVSLGTALQTGIEVTPTTAIDKKMVAHLQQLQKMALDLQI